MSALAEAGVRVGDGAWGGLGVDSMRSNVSGVAAVLLTNCLGLDEGGTSKEEEAFGSTSEWKRELR